MNKKLNLQEFRDLSNGIADEVLSKLKKGNILFVSKHESADRVLLGADLLGRLDVIDFDELLIQASVPKGSKIKAGTHIFYSTVGIKGIASGYIESISGGIAYITGSSLQYLTNETPIKKNAKKANLKLVVNNI